MESKHQGVKVFKCLMCSEVSKSKQSFKEHKAKHQKELDIIINHTSTDRYLCKECNISFGIRDDYLQHLLDKHRNRKNHGGKSNPKDSYEYDECKNGPSCKWLKYNRCNFEHPQEPWKTVQSRKKTQNPRQQQQPKERQQQPRQNQQQRRQQHQVDNKIPTCTNGPSCYYFKQQRCNFYHSAKPNQRGALKLSGQTNQLRQCKFGSNCDNCGFLHLPTDFLPMKGGRRS